MVHKGLLILLRSYAPLGPKLVNDWEGADGGRGEGQKQLTRKKNKNGLRQDKQAIINHPTSTRHESGSGWRGGREWEGRKLDEKKKKKKKKKKKTNKQTKYAKRDKLTNGRMTQSNMPLQLRS